MMHYENGEGRQGNGSTGVQKVVAFRDGGGRAHDNGSKKMQYVVNSLTVFVRKLIRFLFIAPDHSEILVNRPTCTIVYNLALFRHKRFYALPCSLMAFIEKQRNENQYV